MEWRKDNAEAQRFAESREVRLQKAGALKGTATQASSLERGVPDEITSLVGIRSAAGTMYRAPTRSYLDQNLAMAE